VLAGFYGDGFQCTGAMRGQANTRFSDRLGGNAFPPLFAPSATLQYRPGGPKGEAEMLSVLLNCASPLYDGTAEN